jgi:hypothetical protein
MTHAQVIKRERAPPSAISHRAHVCTSGQLGKRRSIACGTRTSIVLVVFDPRGTDLLS